MKLGDLVEEGKKKGTFVGVYLSKDSKAAVTELMEKLDIPNPISSSEMHMTVIYSRKHLPEFKPRGKLDENLVITPTKLDIFPAQSGDNKVLVVRFKSDELCKRHKEIMDEHGATYDFDEYKPHLTLSYDCGKFETNGHDMKGLLGDLEINEEYDEELNLNWVSKK
jgi:2'-5' RNA ligase